MASNLTPATLVADEKGYSHHKDMILQSADIAAGRGQAATDQYGHALVEFDHSAERRLRLKIDLYIVPTVALLYLFCFIDRANIGMSFPPLVPSPTRGIINVCFPFLSY
jgi:hypothetical protein